MTLWNGFEKNFVDPGPLSLCVGLLGVGKIGPRNSHFVNSMNVSKSTLNSGQFSWKSLSETETHLHEP